MTVTLRRWLAPAAATVLVGALAMAAPSASAAPRGVPACAATGLSAAVTGGTAGMSQPAVYITVTNSGSRSCFVKGYPRITGAWTAQGRQRISVTNGAVMNAPESNPQRIVLAPGGKAWFAVGTGTAYDSPLVTFTQLAFTTTGGGRSTVTGVGLQATAPKGKPFPVGVTSYFPGQSPSGS